MRCSRLAASLACILLAVTCLVSCGSESGKNKQVIESQHSKMTEQTQNSTDKKEDPAHILENISIYDFELTDEEMKQMAALHTGRRYENW